MTKRNRGRAHPLSAVPPLDSASEQPASPVPEGFDYYGGATEVARVLEETGLTPSRAERKGHWRGGFCAVEAVHPDSWPPGAELCVEVTYYPPAEFRRPPGNVPDPPGAAEHRRERLALIAQTLQESGFTAELIQRDGWPGRQWLLRVHRAQDGSPAAK
ncbi:hypothetical protein [Streptomyces albipurpureus]|uniref:Uncharacterized protein n=1 Tax=Streptomyces albipurpureus TaxID=2897419 RepID=A0ABT0UMY9_9ACTN|nr:hypothetical protein [Streptomyces sp. CWNU-1]MCM2389804.1 hypothetical protein [Streptomyces sp. CWNU-1]